MAGTIFSLALSQRVDPNGRPESGWKLYLYTANSSIPVTAYKDSGLTAGLEQPNPLAADAYGMMPEFWLADGSYRARGTSADGARTFFDLANVLALGPSSGSGGGGSGVDPNAIFATGDTMFQEVSGTRAGWVRDNGRTIGSATSGATERANADCQALFEWLWNNFTNSTCPVPGGRGASAVADWSANKQITLIDKRGAGPIGLDDMGNSAASRFGNVPFASGNETTAGSICGENAHQLNSAENGPHAHGITDTHTHDLKGRSLITNIGGGGSAWAYAVNSPGYGSDTTLHGHTELTSNGSIVVNSAGSGTAHNTVQRSITGTWFRKL